MKTILQAGNLRIPRIFRIRRIIVTIFVIVFIPYLIFTSSQFDVLPTKDEPGGEEFDDATSSTMELIDSLSNKSQIEDLSDKEREIISRVMYANSSLCVEMQSVLMNRTNYTANVYTPNETEQLLIRRRFSPSNGKIMLGGWWKPIDCVARHTTSVIIPYRDRRRHLTKLLRRLHQVLQTQLISYRIFVVEQNDTELFNKGALLNIAYLLVRDFYNNYSKECVVFHDVDLIPEDDRNLYTCPEPSLSAVRHMSPAVDKMKYLLPYPELVGGVLAINPSILLKVNGYSNLYRGWGGEDDDLYERLNAEGIDILRPHSSIGRFKMLPHPARPQATNRYRLLRQTIRRYKMDGLSSIIRGRTYNIVSIQDMPHYTHILIALSSPSTPRYYLQSLVLFYICLFCILTRALLANFH